MAVAAEQLAQPFNLEDHFSVGYSLVDQSPLLAELRAEARSEAYEIIEQRRAQLRAGEFDSILLDVDALGSARAVIETRLTYGPESAEAQERFQGLFLDCSRLLGEATRAKTYEYFEPVLQTLNPLTGDYYSNGYSLTKITECGLSPVNVPQELEVRVNDRVEEMTYRAIGQMALLGGRLQPETALSAKAPLRRIRTITECPDWALEAHELGRKTGGYVPEINKFMVRDVTFEADGNRFEEQIALPGIMIDGDVIRSVLGLNGLDVADASKLELQSMQIEVEDSLIEFAAKLDASASVNHQQPIFMGEVVSATVEKAMYDAVPDAAALRRNALAAKADELAKTLIELEEIGTDHQAANGLVEGLVRDILLTIAENDYQQAKHMFNNKTAQGFQISLQLRQQGRLQEADAVLAQTKADAPQVSYCGAGSCGLEKADILGDQAKTMKEMGLDSANSLKDTERRCPKCSKKNIVYDLKKKVKACTGCKSTTGFGPK